MSSYSRRLNKVSTPFKDVDSQDAVPSPKKEMYYLFRVDSNEWAGRGDLEELRRIAASQTAGAPKDLRVFSLLVNSALLHRPSTPGAFSRGGNGSKGGPCDSCKVKESPQWRRGPPDYPVLCNACGTRYRRTKRLDRLVDLSSRHKVVKRPMRWRKSPSRSKSSPSPAADSPPPAASCDVGRVLRDRGLHCRSPVWEGSCRVEARMQEPVMAHELKRPFGALAAPPVVRCFG